MLSEKLIKTLILEKLMLVEISEMDDLSSGAGGGLDGGILGVAKHELSSTFGDNPFSFLIDIVNLTAKSALSAGVKAFGIPAKTIAGLIGGPALIRLYKIYVEGKMINFLNQNFKENVTQQVMRVLKAALPAAFLLNPPIAIMAGLTVSLFSGNSGTGSDSDGKKRFSFADLFKGKVSSGDALNAYLTDLYKRVFSATNKFTKLKGKIDTVFSNEQFKSNFKSTISEIVFDTNKIKENQFINRKQLNLPQDKMNFLINLMRIAKLDLSSFPWADTIFFSRNFAEFKIDIRGNKSYQNSGEVFSAIQSSLPKLLQHAESKNESLSETGGVSELRQFQEIALQVIADDTRSAQLKKSKNVEMSNLEDVISMLKQASGTIKNMSEAEFNEIKKKYIS